jgi:Flp pilus assembly protein TadG
VIFRPRPRQPATNRPGRGQALVEFALVFPIFIVLLLGIIEFAFLFNALLSVNYSARDAALAAAEAGDGVGADCVILDSVDAAISAPTSDNRIVTVEIYKATAAGVMIGTPTTYARGGTTSGAACGTTGLSVPYTRTANGYPEATRCNVLAGCPSSGSTTVDNVAVRVTYTHTYVTPLQNFLGGGASLTFDRTSVMRMEPIL